MFARNNKIFPSIHFTEMKKNSSLYLESNTWKVWKCSKVVRRWRPLKNETSEGKGFWENYSISLNRVKLYLKVVENFSFSKLLL